MIDAVQQVRHIGFRGANVFRIRSGGALGRSHNGMHAGRQHKHHAPINGRHQRNRIAIPQSLPRHCDVSSRRSQEIAFARSAGECRRCVTPRAGCIDHHARGDREFLTRQAIFHECATKPAFTRNSLAYASHDRHMIRDHGARFTRRNRIGQREACVVSCGIPVARPTYQPSVRKRRLGCQHAAFAEGMVAPNIAEQCQRVVQRQAGAQFPSRNARALVHRPRECQRSHEMGRQLQQQPALSTGFKHQSEVTVFEISHAAVNKSRRTAGSTAGEIIALDQCGAKTG